MTPSKSKFHHIPLRLKSWDYRWPGSYFITICTQHRVHYFGEIENSKLHYSPVAVIAELLWHQIPYHQKNVELGAFVVMPNHVHGILTIREFEAVGSLHATSPLQQKNQKMSEISPKANSVSSIIRSYKSAVTKHAHRMGFEIQWQSRFHDHIIRNEKSYDRISAYILNNPVNWREEGLRLEKNCTLKQTLDNKN